MTDTAYHFTGTAAVFHGERVMDDYRIEAASKAEWAERALRAEAKLAKVKEAFRINMMHALPNYTHEMFDKDYAEMVGEDLG